MKVSMIQNAFSGGEISKKMYGRSDIDGLLKNSGREITNFIVTTQGTLMRRPGTQYTCRPLSVNSRLIPFNVNSTTSFLLELTSTTGRVIQDRALIMEDKALTNGSFTGSLAGWTDIDAGTGASTYNAGSGGYLQQVGGGVGNEARVTQQVTGLQSTYNLYEISLEVDGTCNIKIGNSSGGSDLYTKSVTGIGLGATRTFTFEVDPSSTSFYITIENPNNNTIKVDNIVLRQAYTFNTNLSDLTSFDTLKVAQSGDTLYLTGDGMKPKKITANGTAITVSDVAFVGGPYVDINDTVYGGRGSNITFTPGATTGATTLTASAATFVSSDVGRLVRFRTVNTAAWGEGTITAYTSATQVTLTISRTLDGTTASKEWQMGAWSDTTGYPKVVDTSQARLIFANTDYEPNGLWASTSSALTTFRPDDNYDDVITASTSFATQLTDVVDIVWLASSGTRVLAGSTNGVVSISNLAGGISSISAQLLDTTQCEDAPAVKAQGAALYITRTGRTLAETAYVFEDVDEGFRTKDMMIWSDHLITDRVQRIVYQSLPYQIVWMITRGGNFYGCTYSRAERLRAWHAHVLGRPDGDAFTDIKDAAILTSVGFGAEDNSEDLYLLASRDSIGATIEVLTQLPTEATAKEDMYYLDCGLEYHSGGTASTFEGFDHLIGETIQVVSGGIPIEDEVVSATGSITIAAATSDMAAGFGYTSTFRSNRIEGGNPAGSGMGKKVKINEVNPQFFLTSGAAIGYNQDGVVDDIDFGTSRDLYNGFKRLRAPSGSSQDAHVAITSYHGLPLNISSIAYDIDVENT